MFGLTRLLSMLSGNPTPALRVIQIPTLLEIGQLDMSVGIPNIVNTDWTMP